MTVPKEERISGNRRPILEDLTTPEKGVTLGGWADQMVQYKFSGEASLEILRVLENLQVHHYPGVQTRFWTPKEMYELWRAVYDAIASADVVPD